MISIKDKLPEIDEDIIAYGYNEQDFPTAETGFTSSLDTEKEMALGNFIDFSFTVTHWCHEPEEKQCNTITS